MPYTFYAFTCIRYGIYLHTIRHLHAYAHAFVCACYVIGMHGADAPFLMIGSDCAGVQCPVGCCSVPWVLIQYFARAAPLFFWSVSHPLFACLLMSASAADWVRTRGGLHRVPRGVHVAR